MKNDIVFYLWSTIQILIQMIPFMSLFMYIYRIYANNFIYLFIFIISFQRLRKFYSKPNSNDII
jgi:hypothetical protein